jgi:amino acid transporter
MRRTIYIGGAAATFVCLALVLAVTDIPAVIAGEDTDPVSTVLNDAFGTTGARIVLFVVLISFLSCAMSLQAAASRLAYSYGRDDMIMGSSLLKKFSATRHVPPYALLVAAAVPALIIFGSKFSTDAITKIISFAAFGIYLAFQMVVFAALRARLKGWVPSGKYTLGKWGVAVNSGSTGLRRHRDDQHGVAADARCSVVRQLDRGAVGLGGCRNRTGVHDDSRAARPQHCPS